MMALALMGMCFILWIFRGDYQFGCNEQENGQLVCDKIN